MVNNTSVTKPALDKKHKSINCHVVREVVAAGTLNAGKEYTATKLDKPLMELVS